ncbi:hypothetical protein BD779DRAFT_1685013 [Infundibulicybe gibba]|nr:hypothetical protein BD779DRAFT_1685013 [Infundibulicybe gibba]
MFFSSLLCMLLNVLAAPTRFPTFHIILSRYDTQCHISDSLTPTPVWNPLTHGPCSYTLILCGICPLMCPPATPRRLHTHTPLAIADDKISLSMEPQNDPHTDSRRSFPQPHLALAVIFCYPRRSLGDDDVAAREHCKMTK